MPTQRLPIERKKSSPRVEKETKPELRVAGAASSQAGRARLRLELSELKPMVAVCEREPLASAVQEMFVAAMRAEDLPTLKSLIAEEKNSRLRAAAVCAGSPLARRHRRRPAPALGRSRCAGAFGRGSWACFAKART